LSSFCVCFVHWKAIPTSSSRVERLENKPRSRWTRSEKRWIGEGRWPRRTEAVLSMICVPYRAWEGTSFHSLRAAQEGGVAISASEALATSEAPSEALHIHKQRAKQQQEETRNRRGDRGRRAANPGRTCSTPSKRNKATLPSSLNCLPRDATATEAQLQSRRKGRSAVLAAVTVSRQA
jgi:hypothetical protein